MQGSSEIAASLLRCDAPAEGTQGRPAGGKSGASRDCLDSRVGFLLTLSSQLSAVASNPLLLVWSLLPILVQMRRVARGQAQIWGALQEPFCSWQLLKEAWSLPVYLQATLWIEEGQCVAWQEGARLSGGNARGSTSSKRGVFPGHRTIRRGENINGTLKAERGLGWAVSATQRSTWR